MKNAANEPEYLRDGVTLLPELLDLQYLVPSANRWRTLDGCLNGSLDEILPASCPIPYPPIR